MHLPSHMREREARLYPRGNRGMWPTVLLILFGFLCVASLVVLRNTNVENNHLKDQLQEQGEARVGQCPCRPSAAPGSAAQLQPPAPYNVQSRSMGG